MSRFASFNSKHVITASVLRFLYTLPLRPDPGDTEYRTRLPGAPPPPLPAQRSAQPRHCRPQHGSARGAPTAQSPHGSAPGGIPARLPPRSGRSPPSPAAGRHEGSGKGASAIRPYGPTP